MAVVCNFKVGFEGVFKISMPMRTEYIIETIQALTRGKLTRIRCVVLLDKIEVSAYEELVLLNDSFYGWFYPMEDLFIKMDKISKLIIEGLSKITSLGTWIRKIYL